MGFEWDELKNQHNLEKHQISFEEAQEAFMDSNRLILKDEKHSQMEDRYFCLWIVEGRIATVRFTVRGKTIRIIGAGYWREGKKLYEER